MTWILIAVLAVAGLVLLFSLLKKVLKLALTAAALLLVAAGIWYLYQQDPEVPESVREVGEKAADVIKESAGEVWERASEAVKDNADGAIEKAAEAVREGAADAVDEAVAKIQDGVADGALATHGAELDAALTEEPAEESDDDR